MARSYNGWAASPSASAIGVNTNWEPIPGIRFPGGIKAGDVEIVMTYLVRQLDARVEKAAEYRPGDDWGWAFRANVNNPYVLSCHASATAIDYNATQHPNRIKYTWTREQARTIHKIIDEELDGVIKWLEGYDEMHFEIRGSAAQVKAVADRLRHNPSPSPNPPSTTTSPGGPVYRIYWFKTSSGGAAAYRCTMFFAENTKQWFADEALYISNLADLAVWRSRGFKEGNTGATAMAPRPSIRFHGGVLDNTPTV